MIYWPRAGQIAVVRYDDDTGSRSNGIVEMSNQASLTLTLSRGERERIGRPRVGILGGGQLARMTAEAAVELGVEIFILEREADSPAGQIVGSDHEVVGDWRDRATLARLADVVDVITLENEFIDPDTLSWLVDRGTPVFPGPTTLRTIGDKLRQRAEGPAAGNAAATGIVARRVNLHRNHQ